MTEKPVITFEDIRAKREDILRIAEERGLTNIRVFGSIARGDATEDSDIDFLVSYMPESGKGWEVYGFPIEMEKMFGVSKVDMVFDSNLYPIFKERVLSEAVEL